MGTIKTIFGEIQPEDLGFVDMHEHLWKESMLESWENPDFVINDITKSQEELLDFERAGGKSLVDMQPLGAGRNIEKLREIAGPSHVNIIAVTGFHKESFYHKSHFINCYQIDELEDLVVSEILQGIEINDFNGPLVRRSKSKAGALKCASSYYNISSLEKKLIESVAKASIRTGAPIITHTEMGTMGLEQAKLIKSYGVVAEKICIGHLDRNIDPIVHEMILNEGVYVQYDCVARVKYHPIGETMNLILKMAEKGYGHRILIGGDWGRASYLKAYKGGPGLAYLPETFRSRARSYGLSDELLHKIFYENPAYFLPF